VLSQVPLSKHHRPTHHHLLTRMTRNPCLADENPRTLSLKIKHYSTLTSHPGDLMTSSTTNDGVSDKTPGYDDIISGYPFCQARSDLNCRPYCTIFSINSSEESNLTLRVRSHFTRPTKLTRR